MGVIVLLAGTDDHLIWVGPVVLNLEESGLTHLESVIRVTGTSERGDIPQK